MCVLQEKRPHLLLLRLRSSLVRGGGSQSVRDTWRDPTTTTSGPGGMGRKEKQVGESPNALVGNMTPPFFCHKAGRSAFLRYKIGKSHNGAVPYIRRGRIGRSAIPSLRKNGKTMMLLFSPLRLRPPPAIHFPSSPSRLDAKLSLEGGRRRAFLSLFFFGRLLIHCAYIQLSYFCYKKKTALSLRLGKLKWRILPPSCVPFCPICAVCIVGKKALSVSSSPPPTYEYVVFNGSGYSNPGTRVPEGKNAYPKPGFRPVNPGIG